MDMEINVLPGVKAPSFGGVAWCNGWSDISLSDNIAKKNWTILFFYPLDFGYITPSELMELENCRTELEGLKCNIVALSTDSAVTHEKFCSIQPRYGGVQGINFPLLEDVNGTIAEKYGVIRKNSGYTYRAYFIIDSNGVVRSRVVGDLPVGFGVNKIPSKVRNLQEALKEKAWYEVK